MTVFCYNNTIIRRAGPNIAFGWNDAGLLYARNNLCWSPNSIYDGAAFNMKAGTPWDYNFFFNWQAPTSTMAGLHGSRSMDPLFVSPDSQNYMLSASSGLRGAGDSGIGAEYCFGIASNATWPNPTLLPRGTSWDVGAYQFTSGASAVVKPFNAVTHITFP